MGTEPNKILVIQTAFLGDVVLTTPLLQVLRDRFPSAYLAVLVIPATKEILSGHSLLDDVLVYDKKGRDRGLKGLISIIRSIRGKGFDTCLLPHRSFRSALIAFLAGIRHRIGFLQSPGSLLYSRRVRRNNTVHEVRRNLELLRPLGIDSSNENGKLWTSSSPGDLDWADKVLNENGVYEGERVIAVAPGSVWATKRWIPKGYSAVIDALIRKHGVKVILLGSRADIPVVDEVVRTCGEDPINLSGKTTLRQLGALLKRCDVLITNDNGAMHVGVAQDIPVVAIFGSTTLSLGYGPYTERSTVVEQPLECRPCGKHGYSKCPLGHFNCMIQISPDDVIQAVEELCSVS